uniref:Uncharacterized protein n=1 Tax=Anguilla anguilla TaxID=7936 RepID=A0A0E9W2D2_ANGAN
MNEYEAVIGSSMQKLIELMVANTQPICQNTLSIKP